MSKLFTDYYLVKAPLLWSILITILMEITWYFIEGQSYVERITDNPLKFLLSIALKLGVFIILAYGYRAYARKTKSRS